MFVICSISENWAICCIDWVGSWLLVGSWFWSWATNSLRKSSLPMIPASEFFAWVLAAGVPEDVGGMYVIWCVGGSWDQARTSTSRPPGRAIVVSAGSGSVWAAALLWAP